VAFNLVKINVLLFCLKLKTLLESVIVGCFCCFVDSYLVASNLVKINVLKINVLLFCLKLKTLLVRECGKTDYITITLVCVTFNRGRRGEGWARCRARP
jgi:hypothetical protein